jgi:hypothetical protein
VLEEMLMTCRVVSNAVDGIAADPGILPELNSQWRAERQPTSPAHGEDAYDSGALAGKV